MAEKVSVERYNDVIKMGILPTLFDKINSYDSSNRLNSVIFDAVQGCYVMGGLGEDIGANNALSDVALNFRTEVDSYHLRELSMYVGICISVMALFDDVCEFPSCDGDHFGCIGFAQAIEWVYESKSLGDVIDVEDDVDSITMYIQEKLGVSLREVTINEYLAHEYYLNDLELFTKLLGYDESVDVVRDDVIDCFKTQIVLTTDKILETYTALFSSGYEVIKPKGLLTPDGIMYIKDNKLGRLWSHEIAGIYRKFENRLGVQISDARQFDINRLVSAYLSNDTTRYCFYKKLLEFEFGTVSVENSSRSDVIIYRNPEGNGSWDEYKKSIISPLITSIAENTVCNILKKQGYFVEGGYRSEVAFALVTSLLDFLYRQLTTCIIVSDWRTLNLGMSDPNSSQVIIAYKFRVADIDGKIPLTSEINKEIIQDLFMNKAGDADAVVEPVVSVGREGSGVIDIQHKFKPTIVNGEPLFAYTALDSILSSGKSLPNWKSILLGKRDDDSILALGSDVTLNKKLGHFICAGSRSGKGVMTLNILAGAVANGKPIFYLDNKPDMASMFRSAQMSDGKMFCVNGDYSYTYDKEFQSCAPEKFNWDKNIPQFMLNHPDFGVTYDRYTAIFYLRALLFCLCVIYVRGNVRAIPELYDKLGGEEGVVIVIDEITAAYRGISTMLSPSGAFGKNFYSTNFLGTARGKGNKDKGGKPIADELGCYATDFITCINNTLSTICDKWAYKGLRGGGAEQDVSDLFVIGQRLQDTSSAKELYRATNTGNMDATVGDVLYKKLMSLGFDGFFGYNSDCPNYMCTGEDYRDRDLKAYTRLSESARNFAYVDELTADTVSNIVGEAKRSESIARNAVYFKPFLIFNSGDEESICIKDEFKKFCAGAGLDFEGIKNMHRRPDGVLESRIGFIPYVNAQSTSGGSVQDVLRKSYDIGNALVQAFIPGYEGDCVSFIYDLRPEAMFDADSMLNAFMGKPRGSLDNIYSEFYGKSQVGNVSNVRTSSDPVDFNNYEIPIGRPTKPTAGTAQPAPVPNPVPTGSTINNPQDQFNRRMGYYQDLRTTPSLETLERAMESTVQSEEQKIRSMIEDILKRNAKLRSFFTPDRVNRFVAFVLASL